MSADLVKLQTELGANHTYRESEQIFSMFSLSKRYINNHDRIKHTAEKVGGQVGALHHVESTVASSGVSVGGKVATTSDQSAGIIRSSNGSGGTSNIALKFSD